MPAAASATKKRKSPARPRKAPAGYSKRSLAQKLGIKPQTTIIIVNPPRGYKDTLGALPETTVARRELKGPFDFIHFFTDRRAELKAIFPRLKRELAKSGSLWVSWPKGASGVATDLTENLIRQIALENGLVDVKVCAVDGTWSGLKLVFRLKDR